LIIPLLNTGEVATSDADAVQRWQTNLIAEAKQWSLFGSVAIKCTQPLGDHLYPVIRALGGSVELELELHPADAAFGVEYLNEGAAHIVIQPDNSQPNPLAIPADRQFALTSDTDEAIDERRRLRVITPTAELASRCFAQRVPIQIPTAWLESQCDFMAIALAGSLRSDRPDRLWPTIIVDPMNMALGLAYSNLESLIASIYTRKATYWSRSRNELWEKGKTSGARQSLLSIRVDCDSDCLRFQVDQLPPGFCHLDTDTCFGEEKTIQTVYARLQKRVLGDDEQSFTRKLARDPRLLEAKLLEEARELAGATRRADVVWEAADVLFFLLVKLADNDIGLDEVHDELARRMHRVVRRKNKLE